MKAALALVLAGTLAGCHGGLIGGGDGVTPAAALSGGAPVVGLAGKCLDDDGDGTGDGNKIQLWDCNGTDAQRWTYSAGQLVGPGGKCLDVRWNQQANGTPVQLYTCNGTSAQRWTFHNGGIVSAGGYCLDVSGGATDDGTQIQLWSCHGGANQQWTMSSGGGGGMHDKTDLLRYLRGLQGKGVISGQYIANNGNDEYKGIQSISHETGKWVGALGIDYYWYGQRAIPADTTANAYAKTWWTSGGLVVLTTHIGTPSLTPSGAPANGGVYDVPGNSNPFTAYIDWDALTTPGTATNDSLNGALDSIADGIDDLASAGVVVIYRAYHESDGGWFWWGTASGTAVGGANPSASQFINLWRYTHDYISNKAGPNGHKLGDYIAWAFTGVDQRNGILDNWPDDASGQYVDIVGNDIYTNSPENDSNGMDRYNAEVATGKVVIAAEFGPSSMPFDETTLVSALKNQYPAVVLWQQWDGPSWGIEYTQNAAAAINDPYVIDRGAVPAQ